MLVIVSPSEGERGTIDLETRLQAFSGLCYYLLTFRRWVENAGNRPTFGRWERHNRLGNAATGLLGAVLLFTHLRKVSRKCGKLSHFRKVRANGGKCDSLRRCVGMEEKCHTFGRWDVSGGGGEWDGVRSFGVLKGRSGRDWGNFTIFEIQT